MVGLHGNVFKPHTGTKTSVILLQKWDDELCPKKEDYPIFFATMQKPSKDNSGDKIYLSEVRVDYVEIEYEEAKGTNRENYEEHSTTYIFKDFTEKFGNETLATTFYNTKYENIINQDEYNALSQKDKNLYKPKSYCKIYTTPSQDEHGHLIVEHDLYQLSRKKPDGSTELLQCGIAETFLEFAKREDLSFFA